VQYWRHKLSGCIYGVLLTREGRVLAITNELTQAEATPANMPSLEFDNHHWGEVDPNDYSLVEAS
jgi:hypothetical protein